LLYAGFLAGGGRRNVGNLFLKTSHPVCRFENIVSPFSGLPYPGNNLSLRIHRVGGFHEPLLRLPGPILVVRGIQERVVYVQKIFFTQSYL
jgi:hypothetical protein